MQKRMNWQSIKFDWNQARAFLATVEEGSLSAAARALGMTQPTLGRQVTALEQALDVVLFERIGQRLVLTPSGLELVEPMRQMADAAIRVSLSASGQSQNIEGSICITASEIHAAYLLPPILKKLRQLQPGIDIELIASNQTSDLSRREADIAVRSFRPTQPELIAKKIKDMPARCYATAEYIERIGTPHKPADLNDAEFIGFDRSDVMLKGLNELGLSLTQRNFPIITQSHLVHWEMTKKGLGIGIVPEDIGDAEPSVRQVLPTLQPITFPIWLTSHRELKTSRRVRLVFDLLAQALA